MSAAEHRRQVLYWRLLARIFDPEEHAALESGSVAVVDALGLPGALLDPSVSVDTVVQRFPQLESEFDGVMTAPGEDVAAPDVGPGDGGPGQDRDGEVRRAALVSKLLLNVFGTGSGPVTAGQLGRWQADAGWFERALGCDPGQLRGRAAAAGAGGDAEAGAQAHLAPVLAGIEGDLVGRMRLREVLADDRLARRLAPSMSLIEQLLRDKDALDGVALANARALIRRFVDDVAAVLRTKVARASTGTVDRSVPPKRVFRNLDMQRTVWKNLPNWSPEDERLYVDRLYFRRTAKRTTPSRLIVVVDQSGSMVDSMVNCTILASIFAGLPAVDVHLVAYDTRALDLTPWVHDPFEVLLRTRLGGGNDGPVAMALARTKITDPRDTVLVWISDFYEFDRSQALLDGIETVHRSGVRFIPVGSVSSSGAQNVNPWFRRRLKELGTPVLTGRIEKLVAELKNFLT